MVRHPSGCPVAQCCDCSSAPAQVHGAGGAKCNSCFNTQVHGKFLKVLKANRAVNNGDRVLVAVSGGACSMALAHLHSRVLAPTGQRPERGKVAFEMHLAHVNMASAVDGPAADALEEHATGVMTALHSFQASSVSHLRIEDVFRGHDSNSSQEQLQRFLNKIQDATYHEDVLRRLQGHLLQHATSNSGCNKLVLGDCADHLAAQFLAAISKGNGYRSTADIQLADAREGPSQCCVVRPLRRVSRKELALYAYFQRLPFWAVRDAAAAPRSSVNHLCSTFVSDLAMTHACAMNAILTSAFKLQGFSFNEAAVAETHPPRADGTGPLDTSSRCANPLPTRPGDLSECTAPRITNTGSNDHRSASPLCSFCRSPKPPWEEHLSQLAPKCSTGSNAADKHASDASAAADLCASCRQLLLVRNGTHADSCLLDALPMLVGVRVPMERVDVCPIEQGPQGQDAPVSNNVNGASCSDSSLETAASKRGDA
jgi:hypothetical protein